jgi:valyl-tRNA synthetase
MTACTAVDRFKARKIVVERIEAAGLLDKIEPHTHMVPHGDRSNVVIEPFLTDQWYVNAKAMAGPAAIAAVRDGKTNFVPKNWEKTYFELDGEHPAVVHLAATLVGSPDPGVVRAGRQGFRRRRRRMRPFARARLLHGDRRDQRGAGRATWRRIPGKRIPFLTRDEDTCSTPVSLRRCGRSRRWAGPDDTMN